MGAPRFTSTGERLALAFDACSKPAEDARSRIAPLCDRLAAQSQAAIATAMGSHYGIDLLLKLADNSMEAAIELRLAGDLAAGDQFALYSGLLRQFADALRVMREAEGCTP